MYTILTKRWLTDNIVEMSILAPRLAHSALPGQFLIVKTDEKGERIPLTICDVDLEKKSVTIVFQVVGDSTKEMSQYNVGDAFHDFLGPLGCSSKLVQDTIEDLQKQRILFVAGGVGTAPVYPQVKFLHQRQVETDVVIGAKNKQSLIYVEKMQQVASKVYIATDDGSCGTNGFVTDVIKDLIEQKKYHYDLVIAIGPMIMMKNVTKLTKQYNIPTIVSLNSLMVDGTGMCGACRVTIAGKTKFTCYDGPEFNAFEVDFEEAMFRQAMYANVEKRTLLEQEEKNHICYVGGVTSEQPSRMKRIPIRELAPSYRAKNFEEVCLGYTEEEAIEEAKRCLQCKNPQCVGNCPVKVAIPQFIAQVAIGNFRQAANIIAENSLLPAVCGRVCPQEIQCEGQCVMGKKGDPIAIGKLERFVADWALQHLEKNSNIKMHKLQKIAIVGSGPAGLTCAADLARKGYSVTIFESLHLPGGVLRYGIPEFRLPKEKVVDVEIQSIKRLGVKIETNILIGRTITLEDLMKKENFSAVFVASGAGLPKFMNIKGENFNGVVSANEFLTRNNLMKAFDKEYKTPNYVGKNIVVVGGGNVAMDAARTAIRLGANVTIVYRRSMEELPARVEEVHHAQEEGVQFMLLCDPIEIIGNEQYNVKSIRLQQMQLGEVDNSGRRKPIPIKGVEKELLADMVIISIGSTPNPLIGETTAGLQIDKYGCIVVDNEAKTTKEGIFAGGDTVSGAATVIMAMGAGRVAATAIDNYLKKK